MSKDLRQELENLRIEYISKLHQTNLQLEALRAQLIDESNTLEALQMLKGISHKLAGSGRTFGLPTLSEAAKSLELKIAEALEVQGNGIINGDSAVLSHIERLAYVCRKIINYSIPDSQEQARFTKIEKENSSNFILIKSTETSHIKQLAAQLSYMGFEIKLITTFEELGEDTKANPPALIIIETEFSETDLFQIQSFLGKRGGETEHIPLLYLCGQNNFTTRLTAVRLEGAGFLGLPTNSINVIDQFYRLTQTRHSRNYHVLIIDDDHILAKRYAIALENVGIQVTVLPNPNQALELLTEKTVDLVLLDFHFQDCNGWEVAKILRQLNHYHYISLPIIFLSTEVSLNHFMRSAHLGIEDFLTKPIIDEDLVSIVLRRAERSFVLRNLIEQDSATGLLNHSKLKLDLNLEVLRSERSGAEFCYALLDIDHFKVVNDTYGHFTGDIVIKTLAHLLQQRLRAIDSIGRYGGEEFGLILPNTTAEEALLVLSQIHKKFSEIEFVAGENKFFVTFSGGIAAYPQFNTAELISFAADEAMYESKNQGRNRLTIAKRENLPLGD